MSKSAITCRYLPAEGEIKRGDYNLQTDYSTRSSGKPVVGIWDGDKPPVDSQFMKFQKVERFAVTTDISVGDLVYRKDDGFDPVLAKGKHVNWNEEVREANFGKPYYKKLAPLSPNVTWEISDGEEIEIELRYDKWERFKLKERKNEFEPVICKVKGPCGHYH